MFTQFIYEWHGTIYKIHILRANDMVSGHRPEYTHISHTHVYTQKRCMDGTIHANGYHISTHESTKTRRINYIERERILVAIKTQLDRERY